jgi:hypothetical protein
MTSVIANSAYDECRAATWKHISSISKAALEQLVRVERFWELVDCFGKRFQW